MSMNEVCNCGTAELLLAESICAFNAPNAGIPQCQTFSTKKNSSRSCMIIVHVYAP